MTTVHFRLDVLDTLRGFAIVAIMLLHNIEHFELTHKPEGWPAWLAAVDKVIWDAGFFLFGGKAYAIFALLFGVTFYLQFQARAQRGEDFRPRFAWRMVLLFAFGLVNSAFYQGDILTFYAVLGLILIPVAKLRGGVLLAIAAFLLLQPIAVLDLLAALQAPDRQLADPASWAYFEMNKVAMAGDSVTAAWLGNLTNGKIAAVLWSWEAGRMLQIPALFMLGLLAGRAGLFAESPDSVRFWRRTLVVALVVFVPLFMAKTHIPDWAPQVALRRPLRLLVASLNNFAFMLVLVSSFVLLFWRTRLAGAQRLLAPLGRMALTSYVSQSVVGAAIYHGFGLGLYKYTGATLSLLIGLVLAALQCAFSAWWLRRHQHGPLEALWHKATWIKAAPRQQATGQA